MSIFIDKKTHSDKPGPVFQPIIYLCFRIQENVEFRALNSPTKIWVSSLQSLPLFILSFQKDIVSVALYDLSTIQ